MATCIWPSGSETETADQIAFWYGSPVGHSAPSAIAAVSMPAWAASSSTTLCRASRAADRPERPPVPLGERLRLLQCRESVLGDLEPSLSGPLDRDAVVAELPGPKTFTFPWSG